MTNEEFIERVQTLGEKPLSAARTGCNRGWRILCPSSNVGGDVTHLSYDTKDNIIYLGTEDVISSEIGPASRKILHNVFFIPSALKFLRKVTDPEKPCRIAFGFEGDPQDVIEIFRQGYAFIVILDDYPEPNEYPISKVDAYDPRANDHWVRKIITAIKEKVFRL